MLAGGPETAALPDRFWSKVSKDPDGCWRWTGAKHRKGYGKVRIRGRECIAHRVAFELSGGVIPAGLQLDHLCRNRACVNPEHLEPVTNAENGRRGASAKLTIDDVTFIRSSPDRPGMLASQFGVHRNTIYKARKRQSWAEVA